jgi:hypothetical protein
LATAGAKRWISAAAIDPPRFLATLGMTSELFYFPHRPIAKILVTENFSCNTGRGEPEKTTVLDNPEGNMSTANVITELAGHFAKLAPAGRALIAEASTLAFRLRKHAVINCGLFWAALRCPERGEGQCPCLAGITAKDIEEFYGHVLKPFDGGQDQNEIDAWHGRNMHCIAESLMVASALAGKETIDVQYVLAAAMIPRLCSHGESLPFQYYGIDIHKIHQDLRKDGSFIPGDPMIRTGTVPEDVVPLYEMACRKAAIGGRALVTGRDIEVAAMELGASPLSKAEQELTLRDWTIDACMNKMIDNNMGTMIDGKCHIIINDPSMLNIIDDHPYAAFKGPLPWGGSARKALGIQPA